MGPGVPVDVDSWTPRRRGSFGNMPVDIKITSALHETVLNDAPAAGASWRFGRKTPTRGPLRRQTELERDELHLVGDGARVAARDGRIHRKPRRVEGVRHLEQEAPAAEARDRLDEAVERALAF